jgi:hypothetical protein
LTNQNITVSSHYSTKAGSEISEDTHLETNFAKESSRIRKSQWSDKPIEKTT